MTARKSLDEQLMSRIEVLEREVKELRTSTCKRNDSDLEIMDQRTGETMRMGNLSTPFSDM